MAQPILSFKQDETLPKVAANLLPCRVHHNGSLEEIAPYWKPSKDNDGVNIAYFRGRKLHGQTIKLPDQYRGVVAERQPDEKNQKLPGLEQGADEDDFDQTTKTGIMKVMNEFDEIIAWGHEALANAEEDPYVRSMDEWLEVAERASWRCSVVLESQLTMTDPFIRRSKRTTKEVKLPERWLKKKIRARIDTNAANSTNMEI